MKWNALVNIEFPQVIFSASLNFLAFHNLLIFFYSTALLSRCSCIPKILFNLLKSRKHYASLVLKTIQKGTIDPWKRSFPVKINTVNVWYNIYWNKYDNRMTACGKIPGIGPTTVTTLMEPSSWKLYVR